MSGSNSSYALQALQCISTAPTLINIIGSSVGSFLDGFQVDPQIKQQCDEMTGKSLGKCDMIKDGDFIFHTIHFYARPIQQIGSHNTENDENTSEQENKNKAQNASNGYHHGLLILSYGEPEPSQYILDRVEGVRFIKVKTVEQEELTSGHLILIKEYNTNIKYKEIKQFIQKEANIEYNAAQNNCLHFVYKFIHNVIKPNEQNEWNNDFNQFWKYIARYFNVNDIEKGKYNKQQNHFEKELLKKKLLLEQKIKTNNDKKRRFKWKVGDKILIKSKNSQATEAWYVGQIVKIDDVTIDDADNVITVGYQKMGNVFMSEPIRIMSKKIKPYIEIPCSFLDPITNKIMTDPVQILRSGIIYDGITVKYMQTAGIVIDPITGILISIGNKKPVVELKIRLQKRIKEFIERYNIEQEIINNFESVKNKKLWESAFDKLHEKYDIKQQQQKIYRKSEAIFYPQYTSIINNEKQATWFGKHLPFFSKTENKKNDEEKTIDDSDEQALLQWNSNYMFINHTSIPIITCMGPSRIGKSFLLNEILRSQYIFKSKNDKKLQKINVFETSDKPDIAQTKGAWISLYGEIDNKEENKYDDNKYDEKKDNNDIALIDQWPEDDISMWSTDDIISWFNSLNPKFDKKYPKLIDHIKSIKLDGKTIIHYKKKDIEELIKTDDDISKTDEYALINILHKRIQNVFDEIESSKITQMYFVDMEGLSHGVTKFTHKIFHGSYAISNVVIWYDDKINSDEFKTLMTELKVSMEVVAKSKRKPAFIYILRNANFIRYNFNVPNGMKVSDKLDYYINHSETFKYFRDMNIFSSIHGYRLKNPMGLGSVVSEESDESDEEQQELYYRESTLNKLIEKIKTVSNKTKRFANNVYILNDQVNNINKYSSLSPEKRIALCNSKLKWFVLSDKNTDEINKKNKKNITNVQKRELQIKNAIITFHENVDSVEQNFNAGYQALAIQLKQRSLSITEQFESQLTENKNEIIMEITKRNENRETAYHLGTTAETVGIGGATVVIGLLCTALSGGVIVLVGGVLGAATLGTYAAGKKYRPEKLGEIEEHDMDDLNVY